VVVLRVVGGHVARIAVVLLWRAAATAAGCRVRRRDGPVGDIGSRQFRAVATYLRLTLWPEPLVFEYGVVSVAGFGEVAAEAVLVLTLLAVTLHGLWRRSAVVFAAWFRDFDADEFGPGNDADDRRAPDVSFARGGAGGGRGGEFPLGGRARRAMAGVAGRVGVGAGGRGLTVRRNGDFATDIGLWRDTVAKRPENPLAHFMLAGALERTGQSAGGVGRATTEALRSNPTPRWRREIWASCCSKLGRRAEAIEAVRRRRCGSSRNTRSTRTRNLGNAMVAGGSVGRCGRAHPARSGADRPADGGDADSAREDALAARGSRRRRSRNSRRRQHSRRGTRWCTPRRTTRWPTCWRCRPAGGGRARLRSGAQGAAGPCRGAAQSRQCVLQLDVPRQRCGRMRRRCGCDPNFPNTRALLERAKARQRPEPTSGGGRVRGVPRPWRAARWRRRAPCSNSRAASAGRFWRRCTLPRPKRVDGVAAVRRTNSSLSASVVELAEFEEDAAAKVGAGFERGWGRARRPRGNGRQARRVRPRGEGIAEIEWFRVTRIGALEGGLDFGLGFGQTTEGHEGVAEVVVHSAVERGELQRGFELGTASAWRPASA